MSQIEQYLQDITQKIKENNTVLFLGAGATCAAGGPNGYTLTKMIQKEFPKADQVSNDLIELCQDVIDTPPYDRTKLEDFIRSKLEILQPTEAHKALTKFDWAAIFTTNYDDIIEVAYRNTAEKLKSCKPIYTENYNANPSDRSKIHLFKIMGSITAVEGEKGEMVLSRSDFNRALIRRRKYYNQLLDFIKSGTIIFIGYSFNDLIVFDTMSELIDIHKVDRLPWSYALFDTVPEMDDKMAHKFSSRKIIPIRCSFEEFFKVYLNDTTPPFTIKKDKQFNVKIKGKTISFEQALAKQYLEFFDILTEDTLNEKECKPDEFFMNSVNSWYPFKNNWDFQRNIYIDPDYKRSLGEYSITGCLKERIFSELKRPETEENKIILIKGMSGVGKTLMLKRLAYDVYKLGISPVLIIKATRNNFDYKLLDNFIEAINRQYDEVKQETKHEGTIKPLIIIDDASSFLRHVNRIKDFLTSRGRSILIVAADRSSEWDSKFNTYSFKINPDNIYELSETLLGSERDRIIKHFYQVGYIRSIGDWWKDIINKQFDNSFFATIFTLVHPSQKPLEVIIKDQYLKLPEYKQRAYSYICAFHQFNLPMNLELLFRVMKCSFDEFREEIINDCTSKVIFDDIDNFGNIFYRSHHRIIASKVMSNFFADPELQKKLFIEIFKSALLNDIKEREICEKLLVEHLGSNSKKHFFTIDQRREMFLTICSNNPTRSLIHHWGLLEIDSNNYDTGEKLLVEALNLPKIDTESFRFESDQNILTSLGTLYSKKGIENLSNGDLIDAETSFTKAEEYFRDAKHGDFPNVHAYHAHAFMFYRRAIKSKEQSEQMNLFGKSIEIISTAKDNVNEDDLSPIYELEETIWVSIGNDEKVQRIINTIKSAYNSPRGYFLLAELLYRKAVSCVDEKEKYTTLETAYSNIKIGLESFANDEHCLKLQFKISKLLFPCEIKLHYEILSKWYNSSNLPNVKLLYEFGRINFILNYFDASKKIFSELQAGIGQGHKNRTRPQDPITNSDGNFKIFEGTIISITSNYDGFIRCDSLRNLKYPLVFRPIALKFIPQVGDLVKFNIEFNYLGPRVERINKI